MTDQSCLNCGEPLRGPYCHACGQPVKGMIRHFRSVIGDALDTVLEYDGRIWHTLLPLYFRPGRITLDYLAGRRIRFVTPFRLVFVLLVVAFLVIQLTMDPEASFDDSAEPGMHSAATVEEVEAARARAVARLEEALSEAGGSDQTELAQRLDAARTAVDEEAQRRIDWVEAAAAARREGREPPPEPAPRPQLYLSDDATPWDPQTNPYTIGWLPDAANQQLNTWIGKGLENAVELQKDPTRFIEAFLGLLPAALFVLMPIFAALLKLFYVFSGRLYMSHMVIALHSHAFLGLALIVSSGLETIQAWAPAGFGLQTGFGWLHTVSLAWMPLYLLIMQRRVYAQGWVRTLIKFAVLGSIYVVLLVLAVAVAALVTLVRG
ncbi:MAG: DUF3667 domain-containing protein [Pseudomonadales bacterium]